MADIGHGITLTFVGFTAVLQGTGAGPALTRDSVETSHMGLTNATRTYMPGWSSAEVTFEVQFDPAQDVPTSLGSGTVTLTWPLPAGQSSPANWAAQGFCTSYSPSAPIDDLMTASVTFQLSGDITFTDSA